MAEPSAYPAATWAQKRPVLARNLRSAAAQITAYAAAAGVLMTAAAGGSEVVAVVALLAVTSFAAAAWLTALHRGRAVRAAVATAAAALAGVVTTGTAQVGWAMLSPAPERMQHLSLILGWAVAALVAAVVCWPRRAPSRTWSADATVHTDVRAFTDNDWSGTSRHEAAHAVAAEQFGAKVLGVELKPHPLADGPDGAVIYDLSPVGDPRSPNALWVLAVTALAGHVQDTADGRHETGSGNDILRAEAALAAIVSTNRAPDGYRGALTLSELTLHARGESERILAISEDAVTRVAHALLASKRRSLSRDAFLAAFESAPVS